MIYAVFLCDKQWKILRIHQCCPALDLGEGENLSDLISEKQKLGHNGEEQYMLELTFTKNQLTLPAVFRFYNEASLVVCASIKDNQEFLEFGRMYPQYQEWAKDHLFGLFHNEYYMIQQMNNQLVDARRRLTRSNRQLEHALKENQAINEKLDQARIFAEQANRSKTRFLANMSHDIRTPMNAIVGLAELMQHHLDEPDILEAYLFKLKYSSQYLLDLINDILDLSKIENGSIELKSEPMDIKTQIEEIVTIIRPQMNSKQQHLAVHCGCQEFQTVLGDAIHFRQILMNIFSNAVKYTPEGGSIQLSIQEAGIHTGNKKYRFAVEDSGIGMTKEFVQHIFEPFAREDAGNKEIQGTGLGMAITKSLIDAMGGSIYVESTLGKGSRFSFWLPFKTADADAMYTTDQVQINQSEQEEVNLGGMHFLCAEDNALNAEILTSMLALKGASCTVYENGQLLASAFESVKQGEYDAVLMDVQMPVMNGYEATRQIRNSKNPLGKEIPIIAMTVNAFSEDVQRCLDAGMDAHIAKPIDMAILEKIMGRIYHAGTNKLS